MILIEHWRNQCSTLRIPKTVVISMVFKCFQRVSSALSELIVRFQAEQKIETFEKACIAIVFPVNHRSVFDEWNLTAREDEVLFLFDW